MGTGEYRCSVSVSNADSTHSEILNDPLPILNSMGGMFPCRVNAVVDVGDLSLPRALDDGSVWRVIFLQQKESLCCVVTSCALSSR